MRAKLDELCRKLGIATKFVDAGLVRREYEIEEDTVCFFANKFGCKTGSDEDIEKSLTDLDKKRWQRALENIYVVEEDKTEFDFIIPCDFENTDFELCLKDRQSGKDCDVSFEVVNNQEYKKIRRTSYVRLWFKITSPLVPGYYEVNLKAGDKRFKTVLAVAPKRCYQNPALENKRPWGFALQLYSVRSERNWGVGDFTDLKNFIKICARCGADLIGLNPLNTLMHDYPECASPYQSVSRLFLNPIYIDVEAVPEFQAEDKGEFESEIFECRNSELIRYNLIYPLKIKIMEKLYPRMLKNTKRRQEFEAFCKEQGRDLERLAVFQCLYSENAKNRCGGWRAWDEEYRNPNSLAVREYAEKNAEKINFFKFLQFEADRQFREACETVEKENLQIGLYRDLAVGVGQDSAEVWSNQDLFFKEAGAGAPPDAFFPTGQKWGLGAFNPNVLKDEAYEPFIKILRANMRHAGALRIDHVMSLTRLYIIPDKKETGTYIKYNFADMLNIVALESYLNKCAIVGESIGNVPDGFIEALRCKNIYSLSVLWAERKDGGWGAFNSPEEYPADAFTSVGTHDMAPLRMWWFGYDIEQAFRLGMIRNEEERTDAYKKREADRWKLLQALDESCVWPEDNPRKGNYIYGEAYPEGIEEAVHRFVAKSRSVVFLAQPEDILHVEKMQNLPGTDYDKHPNWRRKLPVSLEKLENDIAFIRNIAAIHRER